MNAEIRAARILRRNSETVWRATRLEIHRQIYCQRRQDVVDLITEAKRKYYSERLDDCDQRTAYSVLNELSGSDTSISMESASHGMCEKFVNFFVTKVADLQVAIHQSIANEGIPTNWINDLGNVPVSELAELRPVTESEVEKLLKNSNSKTCVQDACPTSVVKRSLNAHIKPLTAVFNASFREGHFPDQLKTAEVKPLLKKSNLDPSNMKNFRPVSNLPTVGKWMERLVVSRLNEHLELTEKLEVHQSAYKSLHSTETALALVFNDIAMHLDSGRIVMLAMIDLSAAFDTISHEKLLYLLHAEYGICGSALEWFRSYFADRSQYVSLGNYRSGCVSLTTGTPQGSVLGPVIYNLYTAPLAAIIEKHGFAYHKYADDLQVYADCAASDIATVKSSLERCLSDVRQWMLRWQLRINDEKSEFIVFSNSRVRIPDDVSLSVGGAVIHPSATVKNLGVMLDKHLRCDQQVAHILRGCNFALRKLGRIRKYIDRATCKRAIHALIMSRIDYCNSLLSGCPSSTLSRMSSAIQ